MLGQLDIVLIFIMLSLLKGAFDILVHVWVAGLLAFSKQLIQLLFIFLNVFLDLVIVHLSVILPYFVGSVSLVGCQQLSFLRVLRLNIGVYNRWVSSFRYRRSLWRNGLVSHQVVVKGWVHCRSSLVLQHDTLNSYQTAVAISSGDHNLVFWIATYKLIFLDFLLSTLIICVLIFCLVIYWWAYTVWSKPWIFLKDSSSLRHG